MSALLTYPLILLCALVGLAAGLGHMLVIMGAILMGAAVLEAPAHLMHLFLLLPIPLPPQTVSLASTALAFIGLPILAAMLLRRVYAVVKLTWFLDRVLGGVMGFAVGTLVRQWLLS